MAERNGEACGVAAIHTKLEDGRPVCLRRVEPEDEDRLRAGIARMSPQSRYLRFFSGAASPPDWVIDRLVDADGTRHIAWGAIDTDAPGQPAAGVARAMRSDGDAGEAEFSIAVVDAYHGLGLGRLLAATLLLDACDGNVHDLRAHVLFENRAAIAFLRSLGAQLDSRDGSVAEYRLAVAPALVRLRQQCEPAGMSEVFAAFPPAAA